MQQTPPEPTKKPNPEEQPASEELQTFPAGVIVVLLQIVLIPICYWIATVMPDSMIATFTSNPLLIPRRRYQLAALVWAILASGSLGIVNIRNDTRKLIEFVVHPHRFNISRGRQILVLLTTIVFYTADVLLMTLIGKYSIAFACFVTALLSILLLVGFYFLSLASMPLHYFETNPMGQRIYKFLDPKKPEELRRTCRMMFVMLVLLVLVQSAISVAVGATSQGKWDTR